MSTAISVTAPTEKGLVDVPVLIDDRPEKRTWRSYIWSSEFWLHRRHLQTIPAQPSACHILKAGLDVSKEEARFLTKLDLTLISSAALGVMIRYLDQ